MILGRKIRSYNAADTGIVAAGVQVQTAAAVAESSTVIELVSAAPVPTAIAVAPAAVTVEQPGLDTEERKRLWGLVTLLRKSNLKLWKTNRRLTKEVSALRADSGDSRLTVEDILSAEAVASEQGQTASVS